MLDGNEVGQFSPGEELTAEATPVIRRCVRHDCWPGANLDIGLGTVGRREARVLCSSPSNPFGNLFRITFQPGATLELERDSRPH
jgi:hypothetical protein